MKHHIPTSRRQALIVTGAALAGGLAAPAVAQNAPRVLRMGTSWPEGLDGLAGSARRLADTITRTSRGKLEIEIGWAGAFAPPLAVHDAVGAGELDLYHSAEYYFQRKHSALNFFTTVPFGLTTPELAAWIKNADGQALWDEVNAPLGVKALPAGGTGVQMAGWFDRDLTSIDDLRGLRVRMPGLASRVFADLGAEPIALSGSGIIEEMMAGTLNGSEWVGPWNDREFGFHKLASRYYFPGFHEPGMMASLGIGLELWQSLSDHERAIIEMAADAELVLLTADYYGNNGIALAQMLREDGVKLQKLPDDLWIELAKASERVVASIAEESDLGRRVYESHEAYRQLVGSTIEISQADYLAKRGTGTLFPGL